jgi:hypothetical protein
VISSLFVTPWIARWARTGMAVASVIEGDAKGASDMYQALEAQRGTFVRGGSPAWTASSGSWRRVSTASTWPTRTSKRRSRGAGPGGGVVEPAWALYERAALLMKRGRGDDAREAAALLDESLALAEKLILAPLVERTRALRQET